MRDEGEFTMRMDDFKRLRASGLAPCREDLVVLYSDSEFDIAVHGTHPDYRAALAEVLRRPEYEGTQRADENEDIPSVSAVDPVLHWHACQILRSLCQDGDLSKPVWEDVTIVYDRDGIVVVGIPPEASRMNAPLTNAEQAESMEVGPASRGDEKVPDHRTGHEKDEWENAMRVVVIRRTPDEADMIATSKCWDYTGMSTKMPMEDLYRTAEGRYLVIRSDHQNEDLSIEEAEDLYHRLPTKRVAHEEAFPTVTPEGTGHEPEPEPEVKEPGIVRVVRQARPEPEVEESPV